MWSHQPAGPAGDRDHELARRVQPLERRIGFGGELAVRGERVVDIGQDAANRARASRGIAASGRIDVVRRAHAAAAHARVPRSGDARARRVAASPGRTWCAATARRRAVRAHSSREAGSRPPRAVRPLPKSSPRSAGVLRIAEDARRERAVAAGNAAHERPSAGPDSGAASSAIHASSRPPADRRRAALPSCVHARLHRREERLELRQRVLGELAVGRDLAAEDRQQRRARLAVAGVELEHVIARDRRGIARAVVVERPHAAVRPDDVAARRAAWRDSALASCEQIVGLVAGDLPDARSRRPATSVVPISE